MYLWERFIYMEHRITIVSFDKKINYKELVAFRGAIANLFSDNTIYHNHDGDSFVYHYPLVQYKIINGQISIIGIDKGADSVESNFSCKQSFILDIYGTEITFNVQEKKSMYYLPKSYDTPCNYYYIKNWLPLNQENYLLYNNLESISEKIGLLEKILSANILSLFNGFNFHSPNKSMVKIVEIVKTQKLNYKTTEMLSFDIRLKCNADLPEFCGIGKGGSRGFGIIYTSHPRNKR